MKTRRAFLIEPRRIELKEIDINPKPNEVLVKTAVCGLCNYELYRWKGIMGTFPQTVGHEWAGEVVETGAAVKNFKPGDRVAMFPAAEEIFEGFSDYAAIDEKQCCEVLKDTEIKYAVAEPLKCIVNVARAAAPETGDNGVIIGCGPMGLWCIQALAGGYLSSLVCVDVDDSKLKLAKKYGATHVINSGKEDVCERIKDITNGHMADFVVEGTGIPKVLNSCTTYLRRTGRGRLVLMSSHGSSCDFDSERP